MAERKKPKKASGARRGRPTKKLHDLEAQGGKEVRGGATDWEARKSYRVWEPNRKEFIYPENWLEP